MMTGGDPEGSRIQLRYIDEKRFDEIVDPKMVVGQGVSGS